MLHVISILVSGVVSGFTAPDYMSAAGRDSSVEELGKQH